MIKDITYCIRDCANTKCFRNKVHIDEKQEYVWQSDFKDCEEYKGEQNNKNQYNCR